MLRKREGIPNPVPWWSRSFSDWREAAAAVVVAVSLFVFATFVLAADCGTLSTLAGVSFSFVVVVVRLDRFGEGGRSRASFFPSMRLVGARESDEGDNDAFFEEAIVVAEAVCGRAGGGS